MYMHLYSNYTLDLHVVRGPRKQRWRRCAAWRTPSAAAERQSGERRAQSGMPMHVQDESCAAREPLCQTATSAEGVVSWCVHVRRPQPIVCAAQAKIFAPAAASQFLRGP